MRLAQGRFWRASANRGADLVTLELLKSTLPEDLTEVKQLEIEIPLAKWNLLVKHARSDRKLLGGLLLDFAKHKDRVSAAVANDPLFVELQRIIQDGTAALVEEGYLVLTPAEEEEE